MADGLLHGTREAHWAVALQELRAALSVLSDLNQVDARSVSAALLLAALGFVSDRLRIASFHLGVASDARDQG